MINKPMTISSSVRSAAGPNKYNRIPSRISPRITQANNRVVCVTVIIGCCKPRKGQFTFIAKWGGRHITEITADDVKRIIRKSVEDGARYQAFHHFALIRRLFNWAIGTDDYGLQVNPCDRLNSGDLIGERHARDRTLTNYELRALWRTTERMGYPYGQLYRLLALTGLRIGEACGAHWSEFDLKRREWTIPAARMKKVKGGAKPFMVPLTDKIIDSLGRSSRQTAG
jgi:integrase